MMFLVYQAVYLEELSAHSLLLKLLDKLGDQQQLPLQQVSAFLRLTSNGVPVRLDDTVVQSMADELSFILIAIKGGWAIIVWCLGGLYIEYARICFFLVQKRMVCIKSF